MKTKARIEEILDFQDIQYYIVVELDKMAGSFIVCFPIGAQYIELNELDDLDNNLREYFDYVDFAISGSQILIRLNN